MKYKYKLKKKTPALDLPGSYRLPEIYTEINLNHCIFIMNPEIEPVGVMWLEVWDNETGELIYRWPRE